MTNNPNFLFKNCTKCGISKARDGFFRNKGVVDGHMSWCKMCCKVVGRAWVKANPEKVAGYYAKYQKKYPEKNRAKSRKWRKTHPEQHAILNEKYRQAHLDRHAMRLSRYQKANPDKVAAWQRAYVAKKIRAIPGWTNHVAIGEFYSLAAIKTKLTGEKWEVDHIVPLQSPLVCGLHTHYNLQVLKQKDNLSKGNRYWLDMP